MLKTAGKWAFKLLILLLFVAVVTIALMIANGFSYDFEVRDFKKNSIIYLDNDLDARVYLDGELVAEKMPTRIPGIEPGEYLVTVEKEGFLPWETEIRVYQDYVKRVKDIILVPEDIVSIAQESQYEVDVEEEEQLTEGFVQIAGSKLFYLNEDQSRVLWSKDLLQKISSSEVVVNEAGDFLLLTFEGLREKMLLQLRFEGPRIMSDAIVGNYIYNSSFGFLTLEKGGSLYQIDSVGARTFIGRLSEATTLTDYYGSFGNFIFETAESYFLSDLEMKGIQKLASKSQINGLLVQDEKLIFSVGGEFYELSLLNE